MLKIEVKDGHATIETSGKGADICLDALKAVVGIKELGRVHFTPAYGTFMRFLETEILHGNVHPDEMITIDLSNVKGTGERR